MIANRRAERRARTLCAGVVALAIGASGCSGGEVVRLDDRATDLGVSYVVHGGPTDRPWLPQIMGGGVALFDADGDGDLDLYFINGNDQLPLDRADSPHRNRFYRQGADGKFVDDTERSGLGDARFGQGVAVGDIDNDGDRDVYVTNVGADQLYRNHGDGRFENVTKDAGIDVGGYSASAAFCDIDRDGWLDIFVTRYVRFDPEMRCYDPAGREDYCGPQSYEGVTDVLLRNRGDGRYEDVTRSAGIDAPGSTGLGVVCQDLDADGWPDILVANDGYANHLWLNQGDGSFEESSIRMGVAYDRDGDPEAGMGVVVADLDGDLRLDAFMTHLRNETNTLYRGLPPGLGFEDASSGSGMNDASLPYTGFGVAPLDVELDGDLDLIVANGRVSSSNELHPAPEPAPPLHVLAEPNQVFVNDGEGRFAILTGEGCEWCRLGEISRGLAVGDLDRDGDQDAVIANVGSPARVIVNNSRRVGHWLALRAVDPRLLRDAIGAQLVITVGDRSWLRVIDGGSSYLSSSEPVAHVGLGDVPSAANVAVEVSWPDGLVERFDVECVDCAVELRRGEGLQRP